MQDTHMTRKRETITSKTTVQGKTEDHLTTTAKQTQLTRLSCAAGGALHGCSRCKEGAAVQT